MIKSMSGFAAATRDDETFSVTATVRSVNHRFLDVQVRLPPFAADLEPAVRGAVQATVHRGRVDVAVIVQTKAPLPVRVELNEHLLEALLSALEPLRARGLITGTLSAADLVRIPQAIALREGDPRTAMPRLAERVLEAVGAALRDLDGMRSQEGSYLAHDLEARRAVVAALVERIAEAAAAGQAALQTRLAERIRTLFGEVGRDEALVAQEIVRFAARSDVSEELARLRGHLAHWARVVAGPAPGRKLDFLLQEMQRELNTLAAKVEGVAPPELIIDAKAELDRMREQVQNVE